MRGGSEKGFDMGCLVVLFGIGVGFWTLCTFLIIFVGGGINYTAGAVIPLVITLIPFVLCLRKYRSPEHQEKMKQAQERYKKWQAEASERKRRQADIQAIRREEERKRTTVVSTRLIGEGSAEYKRSVGSMLFRGAVGGFLAGSAGAVLGMATTKNKNTNKNVRRFLVKYLDGHIEEKEATIGSSRYKEYMAHLEWEE